MFVLPPPPRYNNGNLYTGMPGGGPMLETNNTLEHPTGPEFQLVLGEGVYTLKDDLHLATPPPHPSDAPQPNHNPLATTIGPAVAGTKLSIAVIAPRNPPSQGLFRTVTSQSNIPHVPQSIQEETQSPKSDAGSSANGFGSATYYNQSSSFGDGNPALIPVVTKGKKDQKAKPKNNIVKSNSSYVSRVIPHEGLQKRLSERSPDGLFAFANINRAFVWLDLSSDIKTENMTKVLFTKAHALCHDFNQFTKSTSHLDLVLGFNTGDIIWYEPVSQKYARINKNGLINSSPISHILWLPNKENLFIAAHHDGTLVVYDKEKEDADFVPENTPDADSKFNVLKSVQSRNQKSNPVAAWDVSAMKINCIAFSPDGQQLAICSEDGSLTIMDYINERVVDVFRSFFGAMLCVTWSPDGRYVITGAQDDIVSVWSMADHALVARCEGHHSWVTDVKFDPWRCDERNYRFGSVGEDCRLLLWDFSVGMLGRPKATRQRGSLSGHTPTDRKPSGSTAGRLRSTSNLTQVQTDEKDDRDIVHPVESKASTPNVPPVMSKKVDDHPLSWLGFEEHCILTACTDGHIRQWERPTA
ncbi:related to WD40 repeat protein CreC [Ramularia collo-cygni]|uniref:Related to WD40 repeat protein CreC n=1 Tax=Ramularia collo-cygni TaxID=112498 RepID=A0A2D3VIA1_9PEZI|nr:related to WD40 repeat protein CreC [Ramularia collo-cygni]CZT22939.1 related to WD40 repeat protein CreC [Ramularia collo-cygni]